MANFPDVKKLPWVEEGALESAAQQAIATQTSNQMATWQQKAAQGSTAAQKNVQYYSPGGKGYQDAFNQAAIRASGAKAKELGVTVQYLLTNPNIAGDPAALEAAKTPQDFVSEKQTGFQTFGATPPAQPEADLTFVKDPKTGLELQMTQEAATKKIAQGWTPIAGPSAPTGAPGEKAAGQLLAPSDLAEGTGLTETDIARTTGVNIYRRDLAKEQAKLGDWTRTQGTPKTDDDWLAFHDYVYEGRMPEAGAAPSGDIQAEDTAPGQSAADAMATVDTGDAAIDEFQEYTNGLFTGIEAELNKLYKGLQEAKATEAEAAQKKLDTAQEGFETAQDFDPQAEFLAEMDRLKFQENWDLLSSTMIDIAKVKESMGLGIAQEGQRGGPMSLGTRRQNAIQEKGIAQVGALTAIAEVYQGNMNLARDVAKQSTDFLADYYDNQVAKYETLMDFAKDDVLRLEDQEKEYLNLQITMAENKKAQLEEDKDKITDLLLNNPEVAQKAGITFADSYEEAISKFSKAAATMPNPSNIETNWNDDGSITTYNKVTQEVTTTQVEAGTLGVPESAMTGDMDGLYCGQWADRQYEQGSLAPTKMGDEFTDKAKWVDTYGTKGVNGLSVGDLIITNENREGESTGHAAVVIGIDGDTLTLAESNFGKSMAVTTGRKMKITNPKIYGYMEGSLTSNWGDVQEAEPPTSDDKATNIELKDSIDAALLENNAFGEDGKLSWEKYLWAYQSWIANGKTDKAFFALYPTPIYLDDDNIEEFNNRIK